MRKSPCTTVSGGVAIQSNSFGSAARYRSFSAAMRGGTT